MRLIALAGTTVFGVFSVAQIAFLVYIYIETYRLPPPELPIPGYHHFPIYRVPRDLRDVGVVVFAFICSLLLYLRFVRSEQEAPKETPIK